MSWCGSDLPPQLFDLNLTSLGLAYNNLAKLPDGLRRLASTLTHLRVRDNVLQVLPECVSLPAIPSRKISGTLAFRSRADSIAGRRSGCCSLYGLRYVDLSGNRLQQLPACIAKLKRLLFLDVSRNCLVTVWPTPLNGLSDDMELRELIVRDNLIKTIPDKIGCAAPSTTQIYHSPNRSLSLSETVAVLADCSRIWSTLILRTTRLRISAFTGSSRSV